MHHHNEQPKSHRGMLGPAWRQKLAASESFRSGQQRRAGALTDRWLRDACEYQNLIEDDGAGLPHARAKLPVIFQAFELQECSALVDLLKVMVAGDLTPAEIHQRLDIELTVVEAWEAIFFDARDLRAATSWFAGHVIEPALAAGNFELASQLKLALGAGPEAARLILSCQATLPLDEADRLYQRQIKLAMMLDQATDMALATSQHALKFLKFYTQAECQQQRLELDSRKLEHLCGVHRDRHELASRRLEVAAQRAATSAARPRRAATAGGSYEVHRPHPMADSLRVGEHGEFSVEVCCPPLTGLAGLRWAASASVTTQPVPPAPDTLGVPSQPAEPVSAAAIVDREEKQPHPLTDADLWSSLDLDLEHFAAGSVTGVPVSAL